MSRIHYLITGGAGFIGSHTVRALLSQGHSVRVVDNLSTGSLSPLEGLSFDFIKADISELPVEVFFGIDCVIHLAAQVSVTESVENPEKTFEINVASTERVLLKAKEAGVKTFLFASSCAVYGDSPKLPSFETDALHPISPYAESKWQGEKLLAAHGSSNFKTISFRFFNVYGENQNPHSPYAAAVPKFLKSLKEGTAPEIFGDGKQSRDFIHVKDVVSTLALASQKPVYFSEPVYNLCTGEPVTILELLRTLGGDLGVPYKPVFKERRPSDIRYSYGSSKRLSETMNRIGIRYQPKRIKPPKVSVLMSVFNDKKFVRKAMDSILGQTFTDFEFVIVLDGPEDGSDEIVRSYRDSRIRILSHAMNLGLTRSLNFGLIACKGEWIVRQDADDISLPKRIGTLLKKGETDPELALVGSQAIKIDEEGRLGKVTDLPTSTAAIRWYSLLENPFIHSSVMFRKSLVKGYDESYRRSQDFELWSRLLRNYRVENLKEPLLLSRVHSGNISSTKGPLSDSYSKTIISENLKAFGLPENWSEILNIPRSVVLDNRAEEKAGNLPELLNQIEIAMHLREPGLKKELSLIRKYSARALMDAAYKISGTRSENTFVLVKAAIQLYPGIFVKSPLLKIFFRSVIGENLFQVIRNAV